MARLFYSARYTDRDELEDRLERLEGIEEALRDAVSEADEMDIVVSVDDYSLHMQIVELRSQLAAMDEADAAALSRAYERSVAYV